MKIKKDVSLLAFNQAGFTLLECIFALFITGIILTFIPLIIKTFDLIDQSLALEETYEWNLFIIQLRKEMKTGDNWKVENNKLILDVNGTSVVYEKYGNSIRRRVNDKGHEVVLQKVDSISFMQEKNQVLVTILFLNKTKNNARFFLNEEDILVYEK